MKKKTCISIKNLKKVYTLHHEKPTFVEEFLTFGKRKKFIALSGINLKINYGEKVGIIGPNGAGKTTLLKMIAGISSPTSGSVKTFGKLVSLIELGSGFHPDLVGRENIYLNGLLIGMDRREIDRKLASIIDFADIGDFIDAPLYTYSSGMKLRLGFSIAVHSDPEIIILDEGFSAGDQNFRQKSEAKLKEFFDKGKTIIMVSHWMDYLRENCNRVIWVEGGRVVADGGVEIMKEYQVYSQKKLK